MRERLVEKRFWSRVVVSPNGCWEWIGQKCRDGYGQIKIGRKQFMVHRISYLWKYGDIPRGHFVLHRCDNPPCVNPKHLFSGTQSDNMRDMVSKHRGAKVSGEHNPRSILTQEKVAYIRGLVSHDPHSSVLSHRHIASMFGVSKSTVDQISRNAIWKEQANV